MLTQHEKNQITEFNQQLNRDLSIGLLLSDNPNSSAFQKFGDEFSRWTPRIRIKRQTGEPGELPQIQLGGNLRYQAVPTGLELPPFLDALTGLATQTGQLTGPLKTRLQSNGLPANLTVVIAPHCAVCPQVVRRLISLPLTSERLQLKIIDGNLFPEVVQEHRIRSVPTILLENRFRWTGSIPLEEIIDAINTRDPGSLGPASLENILADGDAGRLAAMMLESGSLIPAFFEVLTHEKWPIRLGAMVVMEEIAEKNPGLAADALIPLWERFQTASTQIQGDILHIFGEIGNLQAVSWLETVLAGEFDAEVKEAAADALEALPDQDSNR